ncbi:hypothetical protein DFH08DRAFT_896015 [Mycena albidolilacea]|uniref:DDE Tnp4 domain-containing protein n=1 Tax=Mycena albidolilacea TaxID=1033008 RepID=A0AAD6ZA44_9AGAR|nr:hypothetical protein DFH08DRAFT_896015 [Mycena albidolilacea]
MPQQSQAQARLDTFFMAESFLAASLVRDNDLNIDLFDDEDNFEADLIADYTLELFEFSALNWITMTEQMTGGDTRGPYNLIPKSVDFFSVCLRTPDCEFRHMFCIGRDMFDGLVEILSTNPIFTSLGHRPQRHIKYHLRCFLIHYRMNSDLWMCHHRYFEQGEYILVDKGYPSTPFTEHMQAFNPHLSSVQIIIEHAFGLLKG